MRARIAAPSLEAAFTRFPRSATRSAAAGILSAMLPTAPATASNPATASREAEAASARREVRLPTASSTRRSEAPSPVGTALACSIARWSFPKASGAAMRANSSRTSVPARAIAAEMRPAPASTARSACPIAPSASGPARASSRS